MSDPVADISVTEDDAIPEGDAWSRHRAFMDANLKANYRANLIHGVFGMTGFRLMFAPTIIPAYLFMLGGSMELVGLGTALLQLGAIVSPIISGAQMESRHRIMPFAMKYGGMMRVMILLVAIAAWALEGKVLLWTTLGLFFLLGFFHGGQRVAFNMLMAKVIPIARRGQLQGIRNTIGGLIAAGLAWLAGHYFIEQNWLGNGYATTFLLAFILTTLGLVAIKVGINEPDAPSRRPVISFRQRLGQFRELLQHRGFRGFLWVHAFATIARVGLPFWTLYVGDQLGLSGTLIGALSLAFLGADTLSNLAWGFMGDRFGFKIVYVAALVSSLAGMVLLVAGDGWMLLAAFVMLGIGSSGWMLAASTMVLEFGRHEDLPMRLAFVGTVESTVAFVGPMAAGIAIGALGYSPLLAATFASLAFALTALVFFVREPRKAPSEHA